MSLYLRKRIGQPVLQYFSWSQIPKGKNRRQTTDFKFGYRVHRLRLLVVAPVTVQIIEVLAVPRALVLLL